MRNFGDPATPPAPRCARSTSRLRPQRRSPRAIRPADDRTGRRGVTFPEVAIAVLILALAIVPLSTLLIRETKGTHMSRTRMVAAHLANNILERYRIETVRDLAITLSSMEAGASAIEEDPLLSPAGGPAPYKAVLKTYRRYVLFEAVSERIGTLKAIVRWTEDGHERELKIGTVVVDPDFPGGRP